MSPNIAAVQYLLFVSKLVLQQANMIIADLNEIQKNVLAYVILLK